MLYLFGAKKMQTSAKKTCFQFAECSNSSAKLRLFLVTSKVFGENVERGIKKKGGSRSRRAAYYYDDVFMMMKQILTS